MKSKFVSIVTQAANDAVAEYFRPVVEWWRYFVIAVVLILVFVLVGVGF